MRRSFLWLAATALVAAGTATGWMMLTGNGALADDTAPSNSTGSRKMLAHMVYFSLNEPTAENKQKVLDACHKHLTGHPGAVFYAAGTCADYKRPVNDRDFDVALQLVFQDQAAHDAYQASARHKQFVDECSPLWKKVRVFDAEVTAQTSRS